MRLTLSHAARWPLLAVACAAAAGCGTFDRASRGVAGIVTPYRVEVVQGNVVVKEQVDALKAGMSRVQVREVLGTPLVTDVFHRERWDYVFTLRRQGAQLQQRRLTLFFRGDSLERWEGDPMPTEAEFVATLDKRTKPGKPPRLQATEEELRRFSASRAGQPAAPAPAAPPAGRAATDGDAPGRSIRVASASIGTDWPAATRAERPWARTVSAPRPTTATVPASKSKTDPVCSSSPSTNSSASSSGSIRARRRSPR